MPIREDAVGRAKKIKLVILDVDGVLTVFNASDKPLTQTVGALAGRPFQLSDVQAGG